jgi:heptosyltransferase I
MPHYLVIKPSSLGDIVHGLQVVQSIRDQSGPGVTISWVVREIFEPIVRACTAVDHVHVFERNGGMAGFVRLIKDLRRTEYDAVLDFQGLARSGILAWRCRTAKRIGRTDAREGATLFYDELVPLPPQGRMSHAVDILLQFCPALGLKPELRSPPGFREMEGLKLDFLGGRPGDRLVVIFPDSRREEKKWPGFKTLTDLILRDDRSWRVAWAGNSYVPDKGTFPSERFVNLTGTTSLLSLPSLVKRADWVVSNDSGPMHLAAALGVKTLGIFGPTDPRRFGPFPLGAPGNHTIQAPVRDLKLLPAKEVFARFKTLDGLRAGVSA